MFCNFYLFIFICVSSFKVGIKKNTTFAYRLVLVIRQRAVKLGKE